MRNTLPRPALPMPEKYLDFKNGAMNFVRVLPRDYARVMEIQRNAQELGYEPDGEEVWTQILEVSNG